MERYNDDKDKVERFLSLNRFKGVGACGFKATCSINRKRKVFVVSATSVLEHSPCCTVAGAKMKSKELRNHPDFALTVSAHGGKATVKALRAEVEKMGYAATAKPDVLWRAQRSLRKRLADAWEQQWAELPRLLAQFESNGAYVHLESDESGTFEYAFLCLPAVHRAIKVAGRPVSSTDFGHMKHDMFDGLNATGMFQLGDGRLIPMWTSIFRESNESAYMWEQCAERLVDAGMNDVYDNAAHFRDRHKGAEYFEAKLKVKFSE